LTVFNAGIPSDPQYVGVVVAAGESSVVVVTGVGVVVVGAGVVVVTGVGVGLVTGTGVVVVEPGVVVALMQETFMVVSWMLPYCQTKSPP